MFVLANLLTAIAAVLSLVLTLYMYLIIARALVSWVSPDPYNPIVRFLYNATEPVLYRVRKALPVFVGGIDFSPIVVILAIYAQNFGNWAIAGQALFALLALAGFFYAIRGGGVMGVIETLEAFTGMASYIRIMAVGLAGAIFAEAINEIVAEMSGGNPGMLVLAVIIGIVLHTLNFVIACFSPFIHAMRLNLLEFFGKFYETGKQQYSPFTKSGGEKSA
jgi:YggT family protein